MTGFALSLVLGAAFVHATWNFLAKKVGGGPEFVWLFSVLTALIYLPLNIGVIVWQQPAIGWPQLIFMLGTMALHMAYFLLLQQGYRSGDLSLVYPLARGTGPTLSTLAAIVFFGERPTALALIGALLVVVGVFVLTGGPAIFKRDKLAPSLIFGLLTGLLIATYTLWDKHAVSVLLIPPLLLDYGSTLGRTLLLAPFARRQWPLVRQHWQTHRWEVIGVACFNPLSYILVLTALIFTPVSYIAPAREMSVLIVVLMGTGLLKEGDTARRLIAAGLIVLGVVALALN
ncbi:MAG: EamA family transporter [Anaerolineae bacterium]|nr:EamA family transporter [Anaerolineae bacterium]